SRIARVFVKRVGEKLAFAHVGAQQRCGYAIAPVVEVIGLLGTRGSRGKREDSAKEERREENLVPFHGVSFAGRLRGKNVLPPRPPSKSAGRRRAGRTDADPRVGQTPTRVCAYGRATAACASLRRGQALWRKGTGRG